MLAKVSVFRQALLQGRLETQLQLLPGPLLRLHRRALNSGHQHRRGHWPNRLHEFGAG